MNARYSSFLIKLMAPIFFSAAFFINASAQIVNTNKEDLIIHIEHFNYEKQLGAVKQTLYNFKGIKFIAYCKSLDVLMFSIDRNVQSDDEKMLRALKTSGYLFQVKENTTIAKVQSACTDKTESQIHHQE